MARICLAENSGGLGGVGAGGGSEGQASQVATGAAAHGYGYPCIECVTGMTADFDIQLTKDYTAEIPSDLTGIKSVKMIAVPSMRHTDTSRRIEKECDFTKDGKVHLKLGPEDVNENDGVWYAEFHCYTEKDGKGELRQNYRAYLCIRKGTTGSRTSNHPPTVMDVRLALMDTSPEMNTVLDDLEFSDMMILHAIERAIDEWEETPPRLARHFDATTFPFREHLIKGAVGFLLQAITHRYMRNRMQYSAAGLTFDRNDRANAYLQQAQLARSEWRAFINSMKTSMNMEECFGVVRQPWFDSGIAYYDFW